VTHPFVDTDVIIRLLTGDDLSKQAASLALFERIETGAMTTMAPVTVIADAIHVLTSRNIGYLIPRREVADKLGALVGIPGFQVQNRRAVLRALNLYGAMNLDFGDCFIIASMELSDSQIVYSWDHHYDRIPGIERREPQL
jgi:predicted nucleic acid-binding protein